MLDVEKIISAIEDADEVEILQFDFAECFAALRNMQSALLICKETFDFHRSIRGTDDALGDAVKAVDAALNTN